LTCGEILPHHPDSEKFRELVVDTTVTIIWMKGEVFGGQVFVL
jgi:hypothetical protein